MVGLRCAWFCRLKSRESESEWERKKLKTRRLRRRRTLQRRLHHIIQLKFIIQSWWKSKYRSVNIFNWNWSYEIISCNWIQKFECRCCCLQIYCFSAFDYSGKIIKWKYLLKLHSREEIIIISKNNNTEEKCIRACEKFLPGRKLFEFCYSWCVSRRPNVTQLNVRTRQKINRKIS